MTIVVNKMKKISIGVLLFTVFLINCSATPYHAGTKFTNSDQVKKCSFSKSKSWWKTTHKQLPSSIANNPVTGEPEFCEFYQFAQDWFLYLISPSKISGKANWEDQLQFPLLEASGTNSCDESSPRHSFNVRTVKSNDHSQPPTIPERIDQAGGVHAIYDQNGNVVFYEVRFSKNLCNYKAIQKNTNFPAKTVELKMAWRVLEGNGKSKDYYTTKATINGTSYNLGLVGWHIVVAAKNHPEFIWSTLDHKNNAVVCDKIGTTQIAYDFTSLKCAQNIKKCQNLNKTKNSKKLKLPKKVKPNDICQVFPYGTASSKNKKSNDWLNIALIKKLNSALQTLFTNSGLPLNMSVWKNYQFTGSLWISDIKKQSADSNNQRGSLKLANTVLETTFQGKNNGVNCFGCHFYYPPNTVTYSNTNPIEQSPLSHIFNSIINGQE